MASMSERIQRVEVMTVSVSAKTDWIFVRVVDANGSAGIGEATVNGKKDNVIAALDGTLSRLKSNGSSDLASFLSREREQARSTAALAATSGIEQAALDLNAKQRGRPVYTFLGDRIQRHVPCYANINRGTNSRAPWEFAERAGIAVEEGYGGIKLAPFDSISPDLKPGPERTALIENAMKCVAAVSERMAGRAKLMVDCHARLLRDEVDQALEGFARLGVSWVEEPVPENSDSLTFIAGLRRKVADFGAQLAGAEKISGVRDITSFLDAGAYDIVMPDIILTGGPSEAIAIASTAAARGVGVSPHNPCGPVMDVHSAHVAAASAGLVWLERQFAESPLYDSLVQRRHSVERGIYHLTDAPGVGLEIDLDAPQLKTVATAPCDLPLS